jgi:ATP-dependent DNA helicase RecG
MNALQLKQIISQGEGIDIEFKESTNSLSRDVFESVCAFLNRNGGHIVLGVKDNGKISGVNESKIDKIIDNFVTLTNNYQKLNPPFYFLPEIIEIEEKKLIYIFIPQSSQVHSTVGKIYDRNNDGDFNITNNQALISNLYIRKQSTYSENRIFPYATISDLRIDLIEKSRLLAKHETGINHPWVAMTNEELLQSMRLYQKDYSTGKEGLTLAAILLFGKDETILSVLPYHRVDAILRKQNLDRYDDRDDIRTNLIDSYHRLMAFVEKHIDDPFYLENDIRISVRNKMFREAISNILIHREYLNPFPSKMIIENERVVFENANKPHGLGQIDLSNFSPFPKNPIIARVFKEIGYADELGSGVRNLNKYYKLFSNTKPKLTEEDIFETIIFTKNTSQKTTNQKNKEFKILEFCENSKTTEEMMNFLGLQHKTYFRNNILNPLLKKELLKMTIPDKPNSSKQKYYTNK